MAKVREEKRTQFKRKSMAIMNSLRLISTGQSDRSGSDTPKAAADEDPAEMAQRIRLLSPEKVAEINLPFDIRVVSYREREET